MANVLSSDHLEDTSTHPLLGSPIEASSNVKVFPLLHQIRVDVDENIDTALTWEQLNAPDVNFAVIRPLLFKYDKLDNPAIIYAFLLVRWHFVSTADSDLAHAGVKYARAAFCEIMAIKLLRGLAHRQMELVHVLTTSWSALQGAPAVAISQVTRSIGGPPEELEEPMNALEIGIASKAKYFTSSPLVQEVVLEIWSGRILYSSTSLRSLLVDNYKTRQITLYDVRIAPMIDHYRLRVPKYRGILDFINYTLVIVTFVVCLANRNRYHINVSEGIFIAFAVGFVLDEYAAAQEHGWSIYAANMWNAFDVTWIVIFLAYLGLRIQGLVNEQDTTAELAFDVLACGAVVLFPRFAFYTVENNIIVLALRSMIREYLFFMFIGILCFSGLLFALWTLGSKTWALNKIAWLMVQVWFGNTFLSFTQAESFHPIFGPILMVIFAAVANTLLITILISILSNTFARVNQHAAQEFLFQFAISTLEGVKSDAIFSYQPPFNIAAYIILWPLSRVLSPRSLHRVNVFLIRVTSFPFLLAVGVYERYFAPGSRFKESRKDTFYSSLPRRFKKVAIVEAFIGSNSSDLLEAIFEAVGPMDEDSTIDAGVDTIPAMQAPTHAVPQTPLPTKFPESDLRHGRSISPVSREPSRSRRRVVSQMTATNHAATSSPLAKLFTRGPASIMGRQNEADADDILEAVKKIETTLDDLKGLPVEKLAAEVRELQERQARIESLLLVLTRGMRGESGPSNGPS